MDMLKAEEWNWHMGCCDKKGYEFIRYNRMHSSLQSRMVEKDYVADPNWFVTQDSVWFGLVSLVCDIVWLFSS